MFLNVCAIQLLICGCLNKDYYIGRLTHRTKLTRLQFCCDGFTPVRHPNIVLSRHLEGVHVARNQVRLRECELSDACD